MRLLMSGLLGLCFWATLAPAEATTRSDARPAASSAARSAPSVAARPAAARPAASRPVAARPQATAARPASRSASTARASTARAPAAIPYSRQQAAAPQRGLRQTAMASCTMRQGRRVCGPATRSASLRWTGGLAPAGMSQASCPDGTMATMAFGHNDVVRCVPL